MNGSNSWQYLPALPHSEDLEHWPAGSCYPNSDGPRATLTTPSSKPGHELSWIFLAIKIEPVFLCAYHVHAPSPMGGVASLCPGFYSSLLQMKTSIQNLQLLCPVADNLTTPSPPQLQMPLISLSPVPPPALQWSSQVTDASVLAVTCDR